MRALVAVVAALAVASESSPALPHPQIFVGGYPTGIAVDGATHTVYVGNGTTNTVSLIDTRSCNARVTSGCHRHLSAVTAGEDPVGIAVDDGSGTVYVANASGTVAALDGRRCHVGRPEGCVRRPATIAVGLSPQFMALDRRTHTLYVANTRSNTVSVVGGRRVRATIRVGPLPFAVAVDSATGSVFVANLGAPRVAVIDGTTCNATVTTGCARRPATVGVGGVPGGIAIDERTDTIYVTGQATNDVALIDGRLCNGRSPAGCRHAPLRVPAGAGARGIAIDRSTGTVYIADTAANAVTVLDGSRCNARAHARCGHTATAPVGVSPRRIAIDEATGTVYVTNAGSDSVSMLDVRTCNGRVHSGCAAASTPLKA